MLAVFQTPSIQCQLNVKAFPDNYYLKNTDVNKGAKIKQVIIILAPSQGLLSNTKIQLNTICAFRQQSTSHSMLFMKEPEMYVFYYASIKV